MSTFAEPRANHTLPWKSTRNANSMENDWKSSEIGGLDDAGADLAISSWTVSLAARAMRVAVDDAAKVRTILQLSN